MKNQFVLLVVAICILSSCARFKSKKSIAATADTAVVESMPAKIPAREMAFYASNVSNMVDSIFHRSRFNGGILVAKHGQVIFEKYDGYANPREHKDSITTNTSFHLASVSKTFTAMAILKLWEQGRLNIYDSVDKYLAGFPCEGVTVETLLNHRSGIPKYDHYMDNLGWDKSKCVTNQDVLDFLIKRRKDIAIRKPNRGFSYSNTNYALLALIIEKTSGMPYSQYLQQTFFDPLGMKDTYVFTKADSGKCLPSYYYNGRPYAFDFLDMVYGDKNIYSTPRDLLKWDQALHNDSLFKPQTLELAYKPYSFEKPGTHNYGLGWRMYVMKNGKKLIYHNGWWHGNRASFYRLLDEDVTIIALCNNDLRTIYNIKKIADLFGDYLNNGERSEYDEEVSVKQLTKKALPAHVKSVIAAKKNPHRNIFTAKK